MSQNRIETFCKQAVLLAGLFPSMVPAASETLPLTVTTGFSSLEWIVRNTGGTDSGTAFAGNCDGSAGMTINEATTANAATNAFDNAYQLFVDDVVFEAPTNVDLTGETFTAGPVVLSGLNTSLEILFSGSVQAARIRAIFANPTNAAITVGVDVPINLGSDTDTLIEQTASGDTLFTIDDRWIVTSDNNVGPDAVNTTVIYGPGTPTVTPLAVTQSVCIDIKTQPEGVGFSFSITIPANTTRSLMFFAGLGDIQGSNNTIAGAIANAAMFNSNTTIDSRLLSGLSSTEQQEILNWDFSAPVKNNAVVNAVVEEDRNFIDDFIGCSVSNSKSNDPTFLLLMLFAMAGLGRKKPGICRQASI